MIHALQHNPSLSLSLGLRHEAEAEKVISVIINSYKWLHQKSLFLLLLLLPLKLTRFFHSVTLRCSVQDTQDTQDTRVVGLKKGSGSSCQGTAATSTPAVMWQRARATPAAVASPGRRARNSCAAFCGYRSSSICSSSLSPASSQLLLLLFVLFVLLSLLFYIINELGGLKAYFCLVN